MVKIVWTELSISDLREIFEYIADDSVRYASITANKVYQRVQPLADHPLLGRIAPEFNEKNIRELIEGNYRIIYRIKSEIQIDVLRIYHTARLLKKKNLK